MPKLHNKRCSEAVNFVIFKNAIYLILKFQKLDGHKSITNYRVAARKYFKLLIQSKSFVLYINKLKKKKTRYGLTNVFRIDKDILCLFHLT